MLLLKNVMQSSRSSSPSPKSSLPPFPPSKKHSVGNSNTGTRTGAGPAMTMIILVVLLTTKVMESESAPSLKFFGPSSHPSPASASQSHRQPAFASFFNSTFPKSMSDSSSSKDKDLMSSGESHEYTRHLREVLENEKGRSATTGIMHLSKTKSKSSRKYDHLFTLQFRGLADLLRQSTGCPECVCGISHREERIVGGRVAEINSYPWLAALEYRTKFYCGATLISNRYVLTAAHCVHGVPKDQITIVFGEHDRNMTHESPTHYRKIETIIRHRSFNRANFYNDIAVLRMDKPIRFSRYIAPACLPIDLEDEDFDGHRGTVAGWGRTQEKGKPSHILREVEVPIITNDECTSPEFSHYTSREITSAMMCAGYVDGKLDACQGDSGGPLNWERDDDTSKEGVKYVIGIVSWGQGCARPKYPGIYTRITKYLDWIRENTLDSCFCSNP